MQLAHSKVTKPKRGDRSASSLPLLDNAGWGQCQQQINAVGLVFVSASQQTGLGTRSNDPKVK